MGDGTFVGVSGPAVQEVALGAWIRGKIGKATGVGQNRLGYSPGLFIDPFLGTKMNK